MAAFFRAVTYATVFVGFLLIYLPSRLLERAGIMRLPAIRWPQIAGMALGIAGGVLAGWCLGAFVWIGHGTPAPFDPPRQLVIRGPYRYVRNPMYCGAALTMGGAALFFESIVLAVYFALFLLAAHLFVMFYEEPTLKRKFGTDYEVYCKRVRRWLPGSGSTR